MQMSDIKNGYNMPILECECMQENRAKMYQNPEYCKKGKVYKIRNLNCEACQNKFNTKISGNCSQVYARICDMDKYGTFDSQPNLWMDGYFKSAIIQIN